MRAGKVLDSIRLKWDRFVIRYSFRDQVAMAEGVREQGEAMRTGTAARFVAFLRWSTGLRAGIAHFGQSYGWLLAGGVMMLCAMAGLGLVLRFHRGSWRKSHRTNGPTAQQMAALKIYNRMLWFLQSHGLNKSSSMTPLEFAGKIAHDWKEASQFVTPITKLYCRVRFGQIPLSPDDLACARAWLAGLHAVAR